jgi:hypothetical protein
VDDLHCRLRGSALQPASDRPGAVLVPRAPAAAPAAAPGLRGSGAAADRYSAEMQRTATDYCGLGSRCAGCSGWGLLSAALASTRC